MLAVRYDAARGDFERCSSSALRCCAPAFVTRWRRPRSTCSMRSWCRPPPSWCGARLHLMERLGPAVDEAYEALAEMDARWGTPYEAEWAPQPLGISDVDAIEDHLRAALAVRRRAEIDRGVTLVGPHRDD